MYTPYISPDSRQVFSQVLNNANEELMDVSTMIRDAVLGVGTIGLEEALVAEPSHINALDDIGYTPLHWAACSDKIEQMALLIQHCADIEVGERTSGYSPLIIAVVNQDPHLVSLFLEHRASVRTTDRERYGVFHLCDNVDMAQILLRAGADPKQAENKEKRTALHQIALSKGSPPYSTPPPHPHLGFSPDELPRGHGFIPDVRGLISDLVRAGAAHDAKDCDGETPFLAAIQSGNVTALWRLYRLGAQVYIMSYGGWDVLDYLAIAPFRILELIECLCAMNIKGTDPDRKAISHGHIVQSPITISLKERNSRGALQCRG